MNTASSPSRGPNRLGDRALLILEVIVGLAVVSAIVGKAYGPAPTVVFLLAAIAAAFTLYVGAQMLSSLSDETLEVTGRVEDEERRALQEEKLIILRGIKELEADLATGKTDEADYAELRRSAEARAVAIIRTLKASDDRWRERAEQLVVNQLGSEALRVHEGSYEVRADPPTQPESAATRKQRTALPALFDVTPTEFTKHGDQLVCVHCNTANESDARYCVGCGRPRREAAA